MALCLANSPRQTPWMPLLMGFARFNIRPRGRPHRQAPLGRGDCTKIDTVIHSAHHIGIEKTSLAVTESSSDLSCDDGTGRETPFIGRKPCITPTRRRRY